MPDFGFNTPFKEQLDFFRNKLNLPSERWDDIVRSAHDRAFIVAGVGKADLLNDLNRAVEKSIAQGLGIEEFRRDFQQIVANHGWTGWTGEGSPAGEAWRTRVIYQTNMATSYAAGRWKQLNDPGLLRLMPNWRYVHADGVAHPRPLHLAWNGTTLPHDHPFWQTHFAPNGWGCHCRVVPVDKRQSIKPPPDGWDKLDPKTGTQIGIDKGFDYAPGANTDRPMKDFIDQKLIRTDAQIGATMWQSLKPVLKAEQMSALREMVAEAAASMEPKGASVVAHVIDPSTVAALAARGIELNDAAVWLRDAELIHAIRDVKTDRGAALPLEVWIALPQYLDQAMPYLDTVDNTLIYAFDLPGRVGKIVVRVNYSSKVKTDAKRKIINSNFIRTGGVVDDFNINDQRYIALKQEA